MAKLDFVLIVNGKAYRFSSSETAGKYARKQVARGLATQESISGPHYLPAAEKPGAQTKPIKAGEFDHLPAAERALLERIRDYNKSCTPVDEKYDWWSIDHERPKGIGSVRGSHVGIPLRK